MRKDKLPDFLIVGAAKAGTTSLYHYLKRHPEIFLPKIKEPQFFSEIKRKSVNPEGGLYGKNAISDIESYQSLFLESTSQSGLLKGECSTSYLYYYLKSIENIKKFVTQPPIVIILRNPIDRAYSNYMHHVRDGYEKLSFEEALLCSKRRIHENWWWGYELKDVGLYYGQVKAYLENFNQVKVYLFEDLKNDAQFVVNDICEFLGVAKIDVETDKVYNKSGIPSNPLKTQIYRAFTRDSWLKDVIKMILPSSFRELVRGKMKEEFLDKQLIKPKMNEKTRQDLIEFYRVDVMRLQELIKRDLSGWLK